MDTCHKLQLFADYFQIWLEDPQAFSAQREFLFTDRHLSDRVWVNDGLIIMFTARNMMVPIELQTLRTEPSRDLTIWDHVVETSINIPSGQLEVFGCGGYSTTNLSVQPGTYRVRLCQGQLASLSGDGLEGQDHYQILLWPGSSIETTVLKRWVQAH
jgi:hypothetical protein